MNLEQLKEQYKHEIIAIYIDVKDILDELAKHLPEGGQVDKEFVEKYIENVGNAINNEVWFRLLPELAKETYEEMEE